MIVWQVLVGNFTCIAAIIALWMHLQYKFYRLSKAHLKIGFGMTLGLSAIASMLLSVELASGVYVDLRTSVILTSAVFGGPLSIAITMPMAVAFRALMGGAGAVQGVVTIFGMSMLGLAVHYAVGRRPFGPMGILAMAGSAGLVSTALMVISPMLSIPGGFRNIGVPIVLLNVLATAAIACIITYFHRFTLERDILRAALTQAPDFHYVKNLNSEFVVTNRNVARYNGRQKSSEMVGLTDFDITDAEHARHLFEAEQDIIASGQPVIDQEEQIRAPNGKDRWFLTSKVVLRNRHGDTIGLAGVTRDITHHKMLEAQVQESRDLLSQAMDEMSDGLAMFDPGGYLVFCNEQYRASFPRSAYARREGAHISDIVRASVRHTERKDLPTDVSEEWIQSAAKSLHSNKNEEIPLFDGRWLSLRTRMAKDGSALVVVSDVTAMKQSEQSLRQLADHMKGLAQTDALTGLSNRRTFDEAIASECSRAVRSGAPLSLLLVDVDRFKAYNDTYGHPAGDAVLKIVSQCLKKIGRRSTDVVARYGGEEFVVLLPETDGTEALALAEQFRLSLQEENIPHTSSEFGFVTSSLGVSTMGGGSPFLNPTELIARADAALYGAKREGRNRVQAAPAETWFPQAAANQEN